jgi:hypothetical protein
LSCKDISYFLCIAINKKTLPDIADNLLQRHARKARKDTAHYCTRYIMKIGFFVDRTKVTVIAHYDFYTTICRLVKKWQSLPCLASSSLVPATPTDRAKQAGYSLE